MNSTLRNLGFLAFAVLGTALAGSDTGTQNISLTMGTIQVLAITEPMGGVLLVGKRRLDCWRGYPHQDHLGRQLGV